MRRRFEVIEEDCSGCGLCSERAPENFEIPAGSMIAEVCKQPETAEEEQACIEATDFCPMGGLRAGSAKSPSAKPSEDGGQAAFVPAGDATPADITSTRLEN